VPVRILFLSAEFGSGHLAAANAIAAACRSQSPDCVPTVTQARGPVLALVSWAYLWQIRHLPSLYRKLYRLPVGWPVRGLVILGLSREVQSAIAAHHPDVIVGTHPFPAGVAAHLNRRSHLPVPVVMALTDFAPHGFWLWQGVERYFAPSEEAAEELVAAGVDRRRITVTGVPIRPVFADIDRVRPLRPAGETARRVLVMGGGLGLGPIAEAVHALADLPQRDLRVTVVCGRNETLRRGLADRFGADPRLTLIGYTDNIIELMLQSDLLVTKPGGITCAEAMAVGLPLLLFDPLPGHEEENVHHLVQTGAARVAAAGAVGEAAAELLFAHPERLEQMAAAARAAGRPGAAHTIASEVLRLGAQVLTRGLANHRA